jgi:4-alpha-glucanotransferase
MPCRQWSAPVLAIPSVRDRLLDADRSRALDAPHLLPRVHAALLEALFASGANLLILPIQDVFRWSARINQPGTVGDQNWTWRLPWPTDRMSTEVDAIVAGNQLRAWSSKYER